MIKIKQMEWVFIEGYGTLGAHICDLVYRYIIYPPCGSNGYTVYRGETKLGKGANLEQAKKLANKDLEELILSAINKC